MSILGVETTSPSAAKAGLKLMVSLLSQTAQAGFTGMSEDEGQLQGRKRTEKASSLSQQKKLQRTRAKAQGADEAEDPPWIRPPGVHFPPISLP